MIDLTSNMFDLFQNYFANWKLVNSIKFQINFSSLHTLQFIFCNKGVVNNYRWVGGGVQLLEMPPHAAAIYSYHWPKHTLANIFCPFPLNLKFVDSLSISTHSSAPPLDNYWSLPNFQQIKYYMWTVSLKYNIF